MTDFNNLSHAGEVAFFILFMAAAALGDDQRVRYGNALFHYRLGVGSCATTAAALGGHKDRQSEK